MAKHTPGPWLAFNADYQRPHDDALLPIFVVGPREFHTVAQVRAGSDDDGLPAQTAANAALIAAAPDLLEAAQLLEKAETQHANCEECEGEEVPELCRICFPFFDDARVKRRLAIAKATVGS